jgi:hypothetical protein
MRARIFLTMAVAMSVAACREPVMPEDTIPPKAATSQSDILDTEIMLNPEQHIAAALGTAPHLQEGESSARVAKITYQGPGQVILGSANIPTYIVKVPTWIVEAESDKGRRYTVEYTLQPGTPADRRGAARLSEHLKR